MSKLQNFYYQNVALKEGHWKKQRDELIETYLKIEDDDLLHPFRKLANLPNKGHGLVGWYGSGASTFGQKLGAFAKLYLVTGDIRLKEKAIDWQTAGVNVWQHLTVLLIAMVHIITIN